MNNTPIVLVVFKRPTATKKLLELILKSGSKKLYIFSDQGRNEEENKQVQQVRLIIKNFQSTHQNIKIITHFADQNLGLKNNILKALNYVFAKESSAIILEDDCLPHPDFFKFCNAMLRKYKDHPKIMSITGTSVGRVKNYSYFFTKYQQCWGWATWRRAWQKYDKKIKLFNSKKWEETKKQLWHNTLSRWYWQSILFLTKIGQINTWDYQWSFAHFINNGLAIMPSVNLIKNIGFDETATNTKFKSTTANMTTKPLSFPLVHPTKVTNDQKLDEKIERRFYLTPVAILGLLRQYLYYWAKKYAHWH